jgi:VIT1/CCC1 family predicted Fe2+/Mn2+ transporter
MQTLFYEEYSPILVMAIVAIVLSVIILGFILARSSKAGYGEAFCL